MPQFLKETQSLDTSATTLLFFQLLWKLPEHIKAETAKSWEGTGCSYAISEKREHPLQCPGFRDAPRHQCLSTALVLVSGHISRVPHKPFPPSPLQGSEHRYMKHFCFQTHIKSWSSWWEGSRGERSAEWASGEAAYLGRGSSTCRCLAVCRCSRLSRQKKEGPTCLLA